MPYLSFCRSVELSFRQSFLKDLAAVADPGVAQQVRASIEALEQASSLRALTGVKKLKGAKSAYRIRLGTYRLGLYVEGRQVEVVRLLPRKDIYRYFP